MEEYIYDGKIMGTDFSISIVSSDKNIAELQAQKAMQKLYEYEERFSRFLPTSELTQLNINKKMKVSLEFFQITRRAIELSRLTHGSFNPLFQIARLGYSKSFTNSNKSDISVEQDNELYNTDITAIIMNQEKIEITLQSGQKLDFGGFLKGYAAEHICKEIAQSSDTITGTIVNIGGDIHTQGTDVENEIFIFSLFNPVTEKSDIHIPLHNQSLSTSGTYKRAWQHEQQTVHHILDHSGNKNPDTDIISISIIHPHGDVSEAYTKAYLSRGIDGAYKILNDTETFYIAITKDGIIKKHI